MSPQTFVMGGGFFVAAKLYEDWKRSNYVRHGFSRERAIARYLARKGARVEITPGSRGAIDVTARWPSGVVWKIQAKSSREGIARPPGPGERARLRRASAASKTRPVIALWERARTRYLCANSGERIYPPGSIRARAVSRRRAA